MNALVNQCQALASDLWMIVNFCLANRGPCFEQWKDDPERMFRYVSFCNFTGRLNVSWDHGRIQAVVFAWSDFKEHIEARHAEGMAQFEWTHAHRGDSLFVAEVIGSREAVAKMWQQMVEKYPHMMTVPIYTYRRDKLVCLSPKLRERFLYG